MADAQPLLPVAKALTRMQADAPVVEAVENVPLAQALDRVLAEPVCASINVPAHDNSVMDGFALQSADSRNPRPLRLIGSALAGRPFQGEVTPGSCVRITTGAPIPAGADCVVMQENATASGDQVAINQPAEPGENIRRCGEDIVKGAEILSRGHRLGPIDLGLLASLGTDQVRVYRRLRVAILSTGDELTAPGRPLLDGHIYDSNRYTLIAVLRRLDVNVLDLGIVADSPEAIRDAFARAAESADAVISSGGVSVGEADFIKHVIGSLGHIHFWKVAIKPGKPFAFGHLGNSRFFGLPGNPVSAVVTLHQLTLPILRHMAGEVVAPEPKLTVKAGGAFRKQPGRTDYQRARLLGAASDRSNNVSPNGRQGSGVLTSFKGANCYVVLEEASGSVAEGEEVTVLPFDRFLQ